MATHYELLGVAPGASHDEIQRAYRQLARDHHPDTLAGASSAASDHATSDHAASDHATSDHAREIMAAINAAWTVLGDPARRRAYDEDLGRSSTPRAAPPDPGEDEPDEREAWWDLDDEPAAPAGLGELLVFIPVGLFALAIAAFAFSLLSQSGSIMALSLVLLPIAGVTFMTMPLVAMMRKARARARR